MNIWITSDLHFGHNNIIRYCNRPFDDIDKMDGILIENHNKFVKDEDYWYCLGDFSFRDGLKTKEILLQLKSKHKFFIKGNHEKALYNPDVKPYYEWLKDYYELNVDKHHMIVLCHYAFRVWNQSHHGSYHCYGHSHGTLPDDTNALSMDVGVDAVALREGIKPENYRPLHFEEIRSFLKAKKEKMNAV